MSMQTKGFLSEIGEIEDSLGLKDYHAFIVWFLEQTTSLSRNGILQSICDGCHDKGIDAIILDETEREVTVLQSKFSKQFLGRISESEIKNLAGTRLYFKDRESISKITSHAQGTVASLLTRAYDLVKSKKFPLKLTFISSKRAPPDLQHLVEQLGLRSHDSIYDGDRIITLYKNYLKDFNPALPSYKMRFSQGDHHILKRFPGQNSYVLTVPCTEVRDLWLKFGDSLFRKNVRNFLGANRANNGMKTTLAEYPDNFWYFNNGITMLCDKADMKEVENYVEIENPQIVNGCQTTKSIGKSKGDLRGDVLLRIVESTDNEFAARLTLFQNTSNPVKNRDLKSNDTVQVRLRREMGRRGYYFEIKRGQEFSKYKTEHRNSWSLDYPHGELSNEDVAKSLAAIEIAPDVAASKGSEAFFDEYYSALFPSHRSVLDCLRAEAIRALVRNTYSSEKWHGIPKAYKFKNRALWYVLRYASDSLKGDQWARQVVEAKQKGILDGWGFIQEFTKIASEYFELLYKAWRKSQLFEGYDSYLTSPEARKDLKRTYGPRLQRLGRRTTSLFERHLQDLDSA